MSWDGVADDTVVGESVAFDAFTVLGADGPLEPLRLGSNCRIRSHSVIYRGVDIGDNFHAGHGVLIREYTRIGNNVSIGSHSVIEHHVSIADQVRVHSSCFVPEWSILKTGAWLGPGVILTNAKFPNRPDTKDRLMGVTVEAGAVVGAGCILLPGIVIGERALIGAGAVVTADVVAEATVAGNPARILP